VEEVLVLAGAGTNSEIATSDITRFLLDWRGAVEPGRNPDDLAAKPFFRWLADQIKDSFPRLADPYAPDVWSSKGEPNFEELLHVVERLTYLLAVHYYDMAYPRLPPYEKTFYELSAVGKCLKEKQRHSLFDILVFATNAILDYVAERSAIAPGPDSQALISRIIEYYLPHLYTLNYDTNLAVGGSVWWTGFEPLSGARLKIHKTGDTRQVFVPRSEPPAGVPIFAQLHGSVLFGWIEHEYRAPHWVIARYPTPPNPHRTPRRIGFEHWSDRTALPLMPMVTAFRKGEKILAEPYASYYHFLRLDAFRCSRWLILGYGGADPHINAVLSSAGDTWDDTLRVYVCNLGDAAAWEGDERHYRYDLRHKSLFMGKVGYPKEPVRGSVRDGVFYASDRLRIAIDGRYEAHFKDIADFFL
jgi:hypothetical protein